MSQTHPLDLSPERASGEQYRHGVRHGISVTAVVLGVYLVLQWHPGQLVNLGMSSPLLAVQTVLSLVIAVLVLAFGLAVAPASPLRTLPMALLAVVLVLLAALILCLRISGTLHGRSVWLWNLTDPGTVALGIALLGWLVVRRRSPLTFVLVLGAAIPSLVGYQLVLAGAESSLLSFSDLLLTTVVGVGAAWLAAGISRMFGGSTATTKL